MSIMWLGSRRTNRRWAIVAVLSGIVAAGGIIPCLAAPPSAGSRLLTVLDGQGRPGDAVYRAESFLPQATEPLEHIFVLRNDTHTPLTLDHLQSSCSCTTPSLVGTTEGAAIAPGESVSVQVSVDPKRLAPGLLHKSVWVFIRGQDAPAATLEIIGAFLPAVSWSPPSLSFGQIEKGTELTLLLRMTPETPRLEQGTELRLVSPDPDVSVTDVPPAAPIGTAEPGPADQAMPLARAFRVRLAPHAHTGRLQGKLTLFLAHLDDPAGTVGPIVDTVSWVGNAAGAVVATPALVAFGTPQHGQAVTKKLLLTGKGLSQEASMLVCASTCPYLHAVLKPVAGNADQIDMEVSLASNTPPGPLEARLTVTERSGEQVSLPVFAVVKQQGQLGENLSK